jgi:hypothetical protein
MGHMIVMVVTLALKSISWYAINGMLRRGAVLKSESLVPTGNGCQSGILFCGASKECSWAVKVKSVIDILRVRGDIKGRVILNNQ